jgi:hypothetical protein
LVRINISLTITGEAVSIKVKVVEKFSDVVLKLFKSQYLVPVAGTPYTLRSTAMIVTPVTDSIVSRRKFSFLPAALKRINTLGIADNAFPTRDGRGSKSASVE